MRGPVAVSAAAPAHGRDPVYLRRGLVIEPLVSGWYAWSFLIAPATLPMFMRNQHLKVMRSFLAAPEAHAAALRDPAMRGGPFLSCPPERAGEVAELVERMTREQSHLLAFAEAVAQLDALLRTHAKGGALEPLYARVPEPLRGYVELVYDLNDQPSMRFFEGLLYRSPYYDPSLQQVSVREPQAEPRGFVFSTPRLREPGAHRLSLPFAAPALDGLYRARYEPTPLDPLLDVLEVEPVDRDALRPLFTPEPPARECVRSLAGPLSVRYFGHACLLVESAGMTCLVDPLINDGDDPDAGGFTLRDLPERIDYAVITHTHQDHLTFETLLQLRHRIGCVVIPRGATSTLMDPSLERILQHTGFRSVVELADMDELDLDGSGTLCALPFLGEHGDLDIRSKMVVHLRIGGASLLCAADSNNLEPAVYRHVRQVIGRIDALFIGMECVGAPLSWLYGALITRPIARKNDQARRFDGSDSEKARQIVECFDPAQVYVYAMGLEPWLSFLTTVDPSEESLPIRESDRLVQLCREQGRTARRLRGRELIKIP